eukprot:2342847-Prymnesium_polylepis.1
MPQAGLHTLTALCVAFPRIVVVASPPPAQPGSVRRRHRLVARRAADVSAHPKMWDGPSTPAHARTVVNFPGKSSTDWHRVHARLVADAHAWHLSQARSAS